MDTIAAIATPPGEGGVAIIRISGPLAKTLAGKIYTGHLEAYKSHTCHFGQIVNGEGNRVDSVLLLLMLAPRSYTGEETVEIHCHGGSLVTREIFDLILKAGARAALPGEFTYRAFMNGKLDLTQAEAVQTLIGAKNELSLRAAQAQLEGALSKKITSFQGELVDIAAILEAWVDFPEEGLDFSSMKQMKSRLEEVILSLRNLEKSFHQGKKIEEGVCLSLVGAPNVGKSSLMNLLAGEDRAIVTDIPGTTRDVLEVEISCGGLHGRVLDTAGIRETEEVIEQEGIRRSKQTFHRADLLLLVLDAQRGITPQDRHLLELTAGYKRIVIWNKVDLPTVHLQPEGSIALSAKEGQGLQGLQEAIDHILWEQGPPSKEEVILTNFRHKQAISQAADSLDRLIEGLRGGSSPEFLASDLRHALVELGKIIGSDITEDILGAIFSKFCVGK